MTTQNLIVTLRVSGITKGLIIEREFDVAVTEIELRAGPAILAGKIANEVEDNLLETLPGIRAVAA